MTNTLNRDVLKDTKLQDILDIPLDMIEDAARFTTPPRGLYHLMVEESKVDTIGSGDKATTGISILLSVKSTAELVDSNDTPVPEGTKFNIFYGEGGPVQYFKTDFKEVAIAIGANTVADLIEKLNGVTLSAVVGHRKNKENPEKPYPQLSEITAL